MRPKTKYLFFVALGFAFSTFAVTIATPDVELPTLIAHETRLDTQTVIRAINMWQKREQFHVPTLQPNHKIVIDIITTHNLKNGCEVGICFGALSRTILQSTNIDHLYSVDAFVCYEDTFFKSVTQHEWDILYNIVKHRLSSFGNRSTLIRNNSVEAAQFVPDASLDFVYIDADHTYNAVKADLKTWAPKVAHDGFIIGDDYGHSLHPGVKRAADEFARNHALPMIIIGTQYVIPKNGIVTPYLKEMAKKHLRKKTSQKTPKKQRAKQKR